MPNRSAAIRQSDLTRYAKAMRAAGVAEWRVVIRPDGTHEIVAGKTDSLAPVADPDAGKPL